MTGDHKDLIVQAMIDQAIQGSSGRQYVRDDEWPKGEGPLDIFIGRSMGRGGLRISWFEMVPKSRNRNTLAKWMSMLVVFLIVAIMWRDPASLIGLFETVVIIIAAQRIYAWAIRVDDWGAQLIVKRMKAQAMLNRPGDDYWFLWKLQRPSENEATGLMPLDEIVSFEVGWFKEWFSRSWKDQLYEGCSVIVAHTKTQGPKMVALHAGPKADLAYLHQIFTVHFIEHRDEGLLDTLGIPVVHNREADTDGSPKL